MCGVDQDLVCYVDLMLSSWTWFEIGAIPFFRIRIMTHWFNTLITLVLPICIQKYIQEHRGFQGTDRVYATNRGTKKIEKCLQIHEDGDSATPISLCFCCAKRWLENLLDFFKMDSPDNTRKKLGFWEEFMEQNPAVDLAKLLHSLPNSCHDFPLQIQWKMALHLHQRNLPPHCNEPTSFLLQPNLPPHLPHCNGGFVEKMERQTPMFESHETRVSMMGIKGMRPNDNKVHTHLFVGVGRQILRPSFL